MTRLLLDTRTDLVEARAFYAAHGFTEIPPPAAPGPYQDHWFEKRLDADVRFAAMAVRVVALTLVALVSSASVAKAQGNPPVEALLPAEGAALPIDPAGIELRYSCPVYIVSGEPPFAVYGGRRDYGTVVATRPEVGNDGRLLQSNWIDLPPSDDLPDNDLPQDQCRDQLRRGQLAPDAGDLLLAGLPHLPRLPRRLRGHAGAILPADRERIATSLAVTLPRRAYGGIPFHAEVGGRALPSGAAVRIQARRGSSGAWKTIAASRC